MVTILIELKIEHLSLNTSRTLQEDHRVDGTTGAGQQHEGASSRENEPRGFPIELFCAATPTHRLIPSNGELALA